MRVRSQNENVREVNIVIRNLRRAMDITQSELAEKMGVTRSTVAKWETGANIPRGKMLIALAEFFNVTVDELIKEG